MRRYFAIVPAAGSGSRFGAGVPKQYLPLLGKPVLQHTLLALLAVPEIIKIWVVLAPQDEHWDTFDWSAMAGRVETLRCGGATRAESVMAGLHAIGNVAQEDDWVLVHDAARPCLDPELVRQLLTTLADDPVGGLLAVPVADTLKRADAAQRVQATVPRHDLWQAQTPQMFRRHLLQQALQNSPDVTDEAGAIEALGLSPRLVPGAAGNLKITYAGDLALAGWLLQERRQ